MGLLENKKGIIFGVANERSIGWAIAKKLKEEGAELAFTYAGPILESRVRPLAESLGAEIIMPCDVTNDNEIKAVFKAVGEKWDSLDMLVHSLAFAKKEELKGEFLQTSRDGFAMALDISAYSLIALAREAAPLLEVNGGSILAMTYLGSEKVIANYNVMGVAKAALEASVKYLAADFGQRGVRVNTISAGPIRTLAAMGISGFHNTLNIVEQKAPLRRNITQDDVAGTALYLLGDLSRGVTGETIFVDGGYNIIGM